MELEKPRNIVVLTTAKGVKLNAIWKQKKDSILLSQRIEEFRTLGY